QDNEITWFDWSKPDTGLQDFTRQLIALRRAHPVFRRARFLAGAEAAELRWFTPSGTEMTDADWADPNALAIALYLDGSDDPDQAAARAWLVDAASLFLGTAGGGPPAFTRPAARERAAWLAETDPYDPAPPVSSAARHAGECITVGPRSVVVLK